MRNDSLMKPGTRKAPEPPESFSRMRLRTTNSGLPLSEGDHVTNQNHFTLAFPLKSPADAKAIAEELPPMMPGLFNAEDAIGTVHYSRFTLLSEKTLLFLGDFDGEFGALMVDFAKHSGPV